MSADSRSKPDLEIAAIESDGEQFRQVLELGRRDRQWLGFLPDQGFRDRSAKGRLLAAVESDEVFGYVLFDTPKDCVKIIHLCVSVDRRGGGIAGALVDELSRRYGHRRGIELRCRRDFPASKLWPKLGFVAKRESAGRSAEGHPLTYWFRSHGFPDLFTYSPEVDTTGALPVALDHNVVIDLVRKRAESAQTRHLLDPWLSEHINLCITDEVELEIENCEDPNEREAMRNGITQFTRVLERFTGLDERWLDLLSKVKAAAPQAGQADHRHVARAVAGGVEHLVTRDQALLDAAPQVQAAVGLRLMRPEDLITRIDRLRAGDRYEPAALHATPYATAPITEQDEFVRALLNYGQGERKAALEALVREALAVPDVFDVIGVRSADGELRGGVIRRLNSGALEIPMIRVVAPDRIGFSIAQQLAYLQREHAAQERVQKVLVTDPHASREMENALAEEGYRRENGHWVCVVRTGLSHSEAFGHPDIPASGVTSAAAIAERVHWPEKVIGAGIPTFVVPIRLHWAADLFDSALAAETLFGRPSGLGLSREHVYYRRPSNSNGICPPARILWYVSGKSVGQKEGSIRALSNLTEVVVDRPLTIFRRFKRLGVYGQDDVLAAADASGRVMALRFVDTELFANPVPLTGLRKMFEAEGMNFTAPRSPQRLEERMFVKIYTEASDYAT